MLEVTINLICNNVHIDQLQQLLVNLEPQVPVEQLPPPPPPAAPSPLGGGCCLLELLLDEVDLLDICLDLAILFSMALVVIFFAAGALGG